jgi:hypothetical protein
MKCRSNNRECEFAEDLQLIDQNTGKDLLFTMCHVSQKGMSCPYHRYAPNTDSINNVKDTKDD